MKTETEVNKKSQESDANGAWEVEESASGVVKRVLIEPSAEYEQKRAVELQAVLDRKNAAESAEAAKANAIRNATTLPQLRSALLVYLGIDDNDAREG